MPHLTGRVLSAQRSSTWSGSHGDLCDLLVQHCESMNNMLVWQGVGIGSRWLARGRIPVPDVFTMRRSYTRPDLTAYEVKVSAADFRGDVHQGKYRRYLPLCNRLFFAFPTGLVRLEEVPVECGVILYNPAKGTWTVRKSAQRRECSLDQWEWQSLLFAIDERRSAVRVLRDRLIEEENASLAERARKLGVDIARRLAQVEGEDERDARRIMDAARELLGPDVYVSQVETLLRSLTTFVKRRELALEALRAVRTYVEGEGTLWSRESLEELVAKIRRMEAE